MRTSTSFALVVVGVSVLVSAPASALPGMDVSAGLLVGGGKKPSDYGDASPNPYGLGFGLRAGATILSLYAGATFLYHLGDSIEVAGLKTKLNALYYGVEGGYDIGLGPFHLRPYLGLGQASFKGTVTGSLLGKPVESSSSESSLYVAPGAAAIVSVAGFFVGADVRYLYPFKKGSDGKGGEVSNASLGFFGSAGVSF